jgi:hypothetical protein
MGTLFALGASTPQILVAHPDAVVTGMRFTFSVAAGLIVVAVLIAAISQAHSRRAVLQSRKQENAHARV